MSGRGTFFAALVRDGNAWMHPDFDVMLDGTIIVVTTPGYASLPLEIDDARDLVQALTQAIAAAELILVLDDANVIK